MYDVLDVLRIVLYAKTPAGLHSFLLYFTKTDMLKSCKILEHPEVSRSYNAWRIVYDNPRYREGRF
jgi:hypothetical protein